jgi:hypothetical protein
MRHEHTCIIAFLIRSRGIDLATWAVVVACAVNLQRCRPGIIVIQISGINESKGVVPGLSLLIRKHTIQSARPNRLYLYERRYLVSLERFLRPGISAIVRSGAIVW